jgi:hypothetical protein
VVDDCGVQALKGIERPVQLYRVIQPSGVRGRFEAAAAAGGLTPFVGREDELRSLMNASRSSKYFLIRAVISNSLSPSSYAGDTSGRARSIRTNTAVLIRRRPPIRKFDAAAPVKVQRLLEARSFAAEPLESLNLSLC